MIRNCKKEDGETEPSCYAETFKLSVLESDIASGRQEQKMCGRVLFAEGDAVKLFRRTVQEVGFSYGYSSRLYVIIFWRRYLPWDHTFFIRGRRRLMMKVAKFSPS
jgi:hypothetical protein